MSFKKALTGFFGINRSMLGLLGMVVLVGMGEKVAERFLPVYLIALGGGSISIGLLNGLDNLLSALYSYPGGWLSDRLGTKRALLVFNFIAMAGFVIVILVPSWPAVIGASFLFLSWTAISLPASMDLVSKALPKNKRTMGVSVHSLVRRIPMGAGPIVGGLFIAEWGTELGVRLAFCAALGMAIVAAGMQQVMIAPDRKKAEEHGEKAAACAASCFSPPLLNLLVADILVRFCEQIPYAFVVVWAVREIASPVTEFEFGVLTSIEMATALLIYVPVAYFADRGKKKPFVAVTFAFFTLFPMALLSCQSFWPLAAAFVLRGLKEFGEPTRKALIMDLAPEGRKAETFGKYYLIRDTVVSLAAFGGAFLWEIGPAVNLATASACGAAGTLWFIARGASPANPPSYSPSSSDPPSSSPPPSPPPSSPP